MAHTSQESGDPSRRLDRLGELLRSLVESGATSLLSVTLTLKAWIVGVGVVIPFDVLAHLSLQLFLVFISHPDLSAFV